MATNSWNTFGLFEGLQNDFEALLIQAWHLRTSEAASLATKAAVVGFAQFSPLSEWSGQHFEFINHRIQGELSPEELSWYEECAESISVFSCLALGALLGKLQAGDIDDVGFLLGDAHLAGFIALHEENIHQRYSSQNFQ